MAASCTKSCSAEYAEAQSKVSRTYAVLAFSVSTTYAVLTFLVCTTYPELALLISTLLPVQLDSLSREHQCSSLHLGPCGTPCTTAVTAQQWPGLDPFGVLSVSVYLLAGCQRWPVCIPVKPPSAWRCHPCQAQADMWKACLGLHWTTQRCIWC